MKNIKSILDKQLCSGCGACVINCPMNCIHIIEGTKVNYPYVNNSECTNCGKCIDVCPGQKLLSRFIENKVITGINTNVNSCYIAYCNDTTIRNKAASGGFITGFLIYLLENEIINGAIVVRQSNKNPLLNEVSLAKTKKQIIESAGSRYSPSSNCLILKGLKNIEGKYVFVGKPCDIEGIYNLEKNNSYLREKIILKIALMCHHTPTREGLNKLLKEYHVDSFQIKKIKYRGDGWPGFFSIELLNNNKIKIPYFKAWNNYLSKYNSIRCSVCDDPLSDKADITVGDPWGEEFKNDKIGHSAVIIRSVLAKKLYDKAVKDGVIFSYPIELQDIIRYQTNLLKRKNDIKIISLAYMIAFGIKWNLKDILNICMKSPKQCLKLLKKIIAYIQYRFKWKYI